MMSYYAKVVGNLYDDDDEKTEKGDLVINTKSETEFMDPKTNRP